jgi:hypothetical protein
MTPARLVPVLVAALMPLAIGAADDPAATGLHGAAAESTDAPASEVAPEVTPAAAASASTPAPLRVTLPASSAVPMRLLQEVSSGTHIRGQKFELAVTDDITAGDHVVIPADSVVTAEVVHAQKAGALGKAGELIIAARYVDVGGRQIRLRAQLMQTGKDKTMAALLIVPFIRGKNLVLPADTEVVARTVNDESFEITTGVKP